MNRLKVLCYIVTYNASAFIEGVLDAIPAACWENSDYDFHVLISDDCSADDTVAACERYIAASTRPIRVQRTRHNLGYGGNQKLGYDYAIAHGYHAVILLHGDGQYHPRFLPQLIAPVISARAQASLGSRMIHKRDALKGRMPFYKFLGNITLTAFQNYIMGSKLAEYHTGLRAYATAALTSLPYRLNSDGYIFDTEILIQFIDAGYAIAEVPIQTHYGEEICHVNGMKYARRIIASMLSYRAHKLGLSYHRQYDIGHGNYASKAGFTSSHSFAIERASTSRVIFDIGSKSGHVARALKAMGKQVYGFDAKAPDAETDEEYTQYAQIDLDQDMDFTRYGAKPDAVLLLEVLERLREPGAFLYHLRDAIGEDTRIIITLPNVAFLTIRLKLLFGFFSYGSRGILDHTHLRFFTFRSIAALLKQQGYAIIETRGIPAPFPLVVKTRWLADLLLRVNQALIFINRGFFSVQIGMVVRPKAISHDS